MNLKLKLILLSRILNGTSLYSVVYDDYNRPLSYIWNSDTQEPTQLELDAEKDVYYLENIRSSINSLSSTNATATWLNGDYSNAVWSDEEEFAANENLRAALLLQLADLTIQEEIDAKQLEIDSLPVITIETKPTYSELVIAYENLIAQRELDEEARINESIRVKDINDRWNNINDIRVVLNSLGKRISNTALELKRIIDEDDQAFLASLEAESIIIEAANVREESLKNLDHNMDRNIFTQAAQKMGTTKFESMVFFSQSWMLKRDYPELYVSEGLSVFRNTTTFGIGEVLDTAILIKNYHEELIKEVLIPIDKFRDLEIKNYLTQKEII